MASSPPRATITSGWTLPLMWSTPVPTMVAATPLLLSGTQLADGTIEAVPVVAPPGGGAAPYPHALPASRRVASGAGTFRLMSKTLIIVDGVVPVVKTELDDVRAKVWSYALDQRAFGPRKLLVAFTDANGQLRALAHANRTSRPLSSFAACLDYLGGGAAAAVAFCDERVAAGPPSPEFLTRFDQARAIARSYGVYLVDWFACDDEQFRAARLTTLVVQEQ